jgi:hypothetical protein
MNATKYLTTSNLEAQPRGIPVMETLTNVRRADLKDGSIEEPNEELGAYVFYVFCGSGKHRVAAGQPCWRWGSAGDWPVIRPAAVAAWPFRNATGHRVTPFLAHGNSINVAMRGDARKGINRRVRAREGPLLGERARPWQRRRIG